MPSFLRLAALAVGAATAAISVRAQCQPATYVGFHQEVVGGALAVDGDLALFGHARGYSAGLFRRRGNDYWTRIGLFGGSGAHPEGMGNAVALRGDVAVLGDPRDWSLPGHNWSIANGAAVIFERIGGTWTRTLDLYPPTPVANNTNYGAGVAIADDGSRVLVSAPGAAPLGELHVYLRVPAGWALEQTITGAALNPPRPLIATAALTNGYLFVGTDDGPNESVYVLTQQGGSWTQAGVLQPPQLAADAQFAAAIAADGPIVAVGAPRQPVGSSTGTVFVYDVTQPGWMTQPFAILPPPNPTMTSFGRAIDVAGDRLAIGTYGTALEHRRQGNAWPLFAAVYPPNQGYSGAFGAAVGLHSHGLLVGDNYYDDDPWNYPDSPGGVHSFDLTDHGKPFQGCRRGVAIEWVDRLDLQVRWPQQAGKSYQIFGSLSGTGPTPVGGVQVPLTLDLYTWFLIDHPTYFTGGSGVLDGNGRASLTWNVPSGLPTSLDGLTFYHAIVAYDATSLAVSNAVESRLVKYY
ncbi:MAG: hypothetical protein KDE27_15770 [Planctomycetes bacterium]|nr:hypothetical protein [Planctomycetota bacterium]